MGSGNEDDRERLFSYGTLRLKAVQLATFGRELEARPDHLPGYKLTWLAIRDAQVVATSGETHHPIVAYTGLAEDQIAGSVFVVTGAELAQADAYEVSDYRRERVLLASGLHAWVYVAANTTRA